MVAISVGIQDSSLSAAAKAAIVRQAERTALTEAVRRLSKQPAEIGVRMAEPNLDFGATNMDQTTGTLTANTETQLFSQQLTQTKVLVFYGVANVTANPQVHRIRFRRTSSTGAILASLYFPYAFSGGLQPVQMWLEQPVIYGPSDQVVVTVESIGTLSERLIFLATVAEAGPLVTAN